MNKNASLLILLLAPIFLMACQASTSLDGAPKAAVLQEAGAGIVFGGNVANEDPLKDYLVALINPKTGVICTGALIERDLVLTAAHCLETSNNPKDYMVVFGREVDPDANIKLATVTALKAHPKYDKDSTNEYAGNDIALVKMKRPAPAEYRTVVVTGRLRLFLDPMTTYIASGYGVTGEDEEDSGTLRKIYLQTKNLSLPLMGQGKLIVLDARSGGPCLGDSGGPLLEENKGPSGETYYSVVGVVSQTIQTKIKGVAQTKLCEGKSYYTNVPFYKAWIATATTEIRAL